MSPAKRYVLKSSSCECDLVGSRVFADVMRLRILGWVFPQSSDWYPYRRKDRGHLTEIQRRRPYEEPREERNRVWDYAAMHQEPTKEARGISPSSLQGERCPPSICGFGFPASSAMTCWFKPPSWWCFVAVAQGSRYNYEYGYNHECFQRKKKKKIWEDGLVFLIVIFY